MTMLPVTSSNIQSIGHDPTRQVLAVQFTSGQTWEYEGVPAQVFDAMRGAPSAGSYFAREIKTRYVGRRM